MNALSLSETTTRHFGADVFWPVRPSAVPACENALVRYCAPTLAGLKTGGLFRFPYPSAKALREDMAKINRQLNARGVAACPLQYKKGRALIYIYRPERLRWDLADSAARELLLKYGYRGPDPLHCIGRLSLRLRAAGEFPHEIGLFLGYPPRDVYGFIQNRGQNCKFSGCWKVYGDPVYSKKQFDRFEKCSEIYRQKLREGADLLRLTVPNLPKTQKF